jgi:chromosome segregation ATPase
MNENAERNKAFIKRCEDYANAHGYFCWEWFFNGLPEEEDNMAGILNAQVQEWYKNNTDLLGVIEKLTKRCGKLEEENENLKLEFDTKVKVVKELNDRLESTNVNLRFIKSQVAELNHCLGEKNADNKELKRKLDIITDRNNRRTLDFNAIFTSLGVNDTRSALDKIMEMKKLIKQNEEEKQNLKDEVKAAVSREEVAKKNLEWRTHEVTDLNNCLARKNTTIKELKQKLTAITDVNALDFNAIFTSLGVNDTRSALDKIMEMKKLIKQNEDDLYLMDRNRKADAKNHEKIQIAYDNLVDRYEELQESYDILEKKLEATSNANVALDKKNTELQESYDNCVNECTDHINEINSLLQNLEVDTVEHGIKKIETLKAGCLITFDFSAEADLRMENEKLKKRIEDLKKDVKFEFDHRMEVLAASTDQAVKMAILKKENARLKNFIKDRTKEIHEMSEEIEKHLAKYKEEKNNE